MGCVVVGRDLMAWHECARGSVATLVLDSSAAAISWLWRRNKNDTGFLNDRAFLKHEPRPLVGIGGVPFHLMNDCAVHNDKSGCVSAPVTWLWFSFSAVAPLMAIPGRALPETMFPSMTTTAPCRKPMPTRPASYT